MKRFSSMSLNLSPTLCPCVSPFFPCPLRCLRSSPPPSSRRFLALEFPPPRLRLSLSPPAFVGATAPLTRTHVLFKFLLSKRLLPRRCARSPSFFWTADFFLPRCGPHLVLVVRPAPAPIVLFPPIFSHVLFDTLLRLFNMRAMEFLFLEFVRPPALQALGG